ncbi:MAG: hypothetical protein MSA28_03850 [Prevotella sp.]|nr:hypothetical protein [Prevotella sp.]
MYPAARRKRAAKPCDKAQRGRAGHKGGGRRKAAAKRRSTAAEPSANALGTRAKGEERQRRSSGATLGEAQR